jgi:hypothetical protein
MVGVMNSQPMVRVLSPAPPAPILVAVRCIALSFPPED